MYSSIPSFEFGVLEAFRQGEQWAFKRVYDHYFTPLSNWLYSITNGKLEAEAYTEEDILSDCFYRLFKHRVTLQSWDHVGGYLYKIAKSILINEWRSRGTKIKFLNSLPPSEVEEPATDLCGQLVNLIKTNNFGFAAREKQIFDLYFTHLKSTDEIIAITGLAQQTVLNTKTRAIEALKKKLYLIDREKIEVRTVKRPAKPKKVFIPKERPPRTDISRTIKCIENGIIYPSIKKAAELLHCCPTGIGAVLGGRISRHHGYSFEYVK